MGFYYPYNGQSVTGKLPLRSFIFQQADSVCFKISYCRPDRSERVSSYDFNCFLNIFTYLPITTAATRAAVRSEAGSEYHTPSTPK